MNTTTASLRIARGATVMGAAAGIFSMAKMGGQFSIGMFLFAGWVLLPFMLTLVGLARWRPSIAGTGALLAGSCFGLALYLDLVLPWSRVTSTAGLAFLFVPLRQTLWCSFAIAVWVRPRSRRVKPSTEPGEPDEEESLEP